MPFHIGWKTADQTTNHSFLSLSASLDTKDNLQGGIIVEWKKFWQEIPLWWHWCKIMTSLKIVVSVRGIDGDTSSFSQQNWLKNTNLRRCQLADCILHSGLNRNVFWGPYNLFLPIDMSNLQNWGHFQYRLSNWHLLIYLLSGEPHTSG